MSVVPDKLIEIQKNIRENSQNIQEYFKDLYNWEKDIVVKDNKLRGIESQATSSVVNEIPKVIKKEDKITSEDKLKRDKASIKDFYDRWDKFKIEEKEEENVNNETKSKTAMSSIIFQQQNKQSNAQTNTNIVIKNNRMVGSNSNDHVERLKNEVKFIDIKGNTHFSIGNYYRSLEAYTSALKTIETKKNEMENYEKRKCQILNNRGNNYIKLGQYNDALNDLNLVIELENDNAKGIFRRGVAFFNLKKFREAVDDFYFLNELSKTEEKDVNAYIEKCENEIKTRIGEELKKMKQFDPSEKVEFHKLNIKEISLEDIKTIEDMEVPYNHIFEKNNTKIIDVNSKFKIDFDEKKESKINTELKNHFEVKQEFKKNSVIDIKDNFKNESCVPKISIINETKYQYDHLNLTATLLKQNFRNYKNNMSEKVNFLLQIQPDSIFKILDSDFDRDILCEIIDVLEMISKENNQICEKFTLDFLKNLTKTKRFKLVIKTLSKNDKSKITRIFDEFKNTSESEIFSIRNSFV